MRLQRRGRRGRRLVGVARQLRLRGEPAADAPSAAPRSSAAGCSSGWPATPAPSCLCSRPWPGRTSTWPAAPSAFAAPRRRPGTARSRSTRAWRPARRRTRGPPRRAGAGRLEQRPTRSRRRVRPSRHPEGQPAQLPPHLRELAGAARRRPVRRRQADGPRLDRDGAAPLRAPQPEELQRRDRAAPQVPRDHREAFTDGNPPGERPGSVSPVCQSGWKPMVPMARMAFPPCPSADLQPCGTNPLPSKIRER